MSIDEKKSTFVYGCGHLSGITFFNSNNPHSPISSLDIEGVRGGGPGEVSLDAISVECNKIGAEMLLNNGFKLSDDQCSCVTTKKEDMQRLFSFIKNLFELEQPFGTAIHVAINTNSLMQLITLSKERSSKN